MASYSSYKGTRLHEHAYLLSEVLKRELGFDGLVVVSATRKCQRAPLNAPSSSG